MKNMSVKLPVDADSGPFHVHTLVWLTSVNNQAVPQQQQQRKWKKRKIRFHLHSDCVSHSRRKLNHVAIAESSTFIFVAFHVNPLETVALAPSSLAIATSTLSPATFYTPFHLARLHSSNPPVSLWSTAIHHVSQPASAS